MPIEDQKPEPISPPPRPIEPDVEETESEAQAAAQPRGTAAPSHRRPGRSITLPARRGSLRGWIVLASLLLISLPLLLVQLRHPHVRDSSEAITLTTSIQTWQYQRRMTTMPAFSVDRLVPYYNEEIQWQLPPGVTWLHLIAFHLAADDRTDMADLIWIGRLTGVAMTLLALVGVFWAGHSIGGIRPAILAAMICAGSPIWLYDGRLAEPAMVYVAWSILSIAAALWAIRPLKPAPTVWRQGLGWGLCGVAMAAAVLSVGPGALAGCCLPILLVLFICPNRLSHSLGLVAAFLIAVLIVLPWAVYAHQGDPAAWPTEIGAWVPVDWLEPHVLFSRAFERLGIALLALIPWTLWLIAGVVQPFSSSSEGVRAKLFIGLGWFAVSLLVFMGSTKEGGSATLLAVIPAAAILFAELFEHYRSLADMGRYARFWRIMRWVHVFVLICVTMLVPTMLFIRPSALPFKVPVDRLVGPVNWLFAVGVTAALAAMLVLSIRWASKHYPVKAAIAWNLWGIMLLFALLLPLSTGPLSENPLKSDGTDVAGITRGAKLFYLAPLPEAGVARRAPSTPDPVLVLYARQSIPVITQEGLSQMAEENTEFYLLAPRGTQPPIEGMTPSLELTSIDLKLWRYRASL